MNTPKRNLLLTTTIFLALLFAALSIPTHADKDDDAPIVPVVTRPHADAAKLPR